jgi:16S rRNA G1207 methylase RsmC
VRREQPVTCESDQRTTSIGEEEEGGTVDISTSRGVFAADKIENGSRESLVTYREGGG